MYRLGEGVYSPDQTKLLVTHIETRLGGTTEMIADAILASSLDNKGYRHLIHLVIFGFGYGRICTELAICIRIRIYNLK